MGVWVGGAQSDIAGLREGERESGRSRPQGEAASKRVSRSPPPSRQDPCLPISVGLERALTAWAGFAGRGGESRRRGARGRRSPLSLRAPDVPPERASPPPLSGRPRASPLLPSARPTWLGQVVGRETGGVREGCDEGDRPSGGREHKGRQTAPPLAFGSSRCLRPQPPLAAPAHRCFISPPLLSSPRSSTVHPAQDPGLLRLRRRGKRKEKD